MGFPAEPEPGRLARAWEWRVRRPWRLATRFTVPANGGDNGPGTWGYLGYVGHCNYGDDVLYDVITRKLLPGPRHEVADLPRFPRSLVADAADLPGSVDLSRFQAMVLGGGTLIYREAYLRLAERALERGLPLLVMGTGVGDVEFWSARLREVKFDELIGRWIRVLKAAALVGVRGPRSVQALEAFGIEGVEQIGDPALFVTAETELRPQQNRAIGINLGTHDPIWGNQGRLNAEIASFAKAMIAQGREIRFVSMSPIDTRVGEELGRATGSAGYCIVERPEEIESAIAGCQLMIGQRLHSVILAFAYGVPAVSLSYQPKCLDFLESVGLPELSLKTDQIESARLAGLVTEMEASRDQTSAAIVAKVRRFQEVQRDFGRRALAAVQGRAAAIPSA